MDIRGGSMGWLGFMGRKVSFKCFVEGILCTEEL